MTQRQVSEGTLRAVFQSNLSITKWMTLRSNLKEYVGEKYLGRLPSANSIKELNPVVTKSMKAILEVQTIDGMSFVNYNKATEFLGNSSRELLPVKLFLDDRKNRNAEMILAMCSFLHEDAMSRNGQLVLAVGSTLSKNLIGDFGAKEQFTINIVEPLKSKIKENNTLQLYQYLSVCDMKAAWEMIKKEMWSTTTGQMLLSHAAMIAVIVQNAPRSLKLDDSHKSKLINSLLPPGTNFDVHHLKILKQNPCVDTFTTQSDINPHPFRPFKAQHVAYDSIFIETILKPLNLSEDVANLLPNPGSQFWAAESVCSRCLCSASLARVDLYDLSEAGVCLPLPLSIADYNLFGLQGKNHVDDILHFGARTEEHMLNRTCLFEPDVAHALAEEIKERTCPKVVLRVKTLHSTDFDDCNIDADMSDGTKCGFSFLDASHVFDIAAVVPDALQARFRSDPMDDSEFIPILQFIDLHPESEFSGAAELISQFQQYFHSLDRKSAIDCAITRMIDALLPRWESLRSANLARSNCDTVKERDVKRFEELQQRLHADIVTRTASLRGKTRADLQALAKNLSLRLPRSAKKEDFESAIVSKWAADAKKRVDLECSLGSAETRVMWILYSFILLLVNTPEQMVPSVRSKQGILQKIINKFCHLHVVLLNSAPYYLHRLKRHFFEQVEQVGSLRKLANYIIF